MIKVTRRTIGSLLVLIALAMGGSTVIGCKYFPESTFELARESRLPKWFSLPPGLARGDVSVTMNYYVKPSGSTATFILHDKKGHTLAETEGKFKNSEPLDLKGSPQTGAISYPCFDVITSNGVTEVIEHKKMEPIFYVTENAPFQN